MIDLKKIAKSLILSVLTLRLSVTVLYATSTIGANIVTTGTLAVTDTSTLTGAVTTGGALTVGTTLNVGTTITATGGTTALAGATTTVFTNSGVSYLSGNVIVNSVASSSPAKELSVVGDAMLNSSSGTTTIKVHSRSDSLRGGCIELEGPAGTVFKLYATSTGMAFFNAGGCEDGN